MIRFDDSASPRVCDHRDDGSSELDRLFLSLLPQGIPRSLHLQKGPVGVCPPLFLRSVAGFAMWRRNTRDQELLHRVWQDLSKTRRLNRTDQKRWEGFG